MAREFPLLHLRCSWCKNLFDWQMKSSSRILQVGVPRTCGVRCKGSLASYEFNLWANITRERGMKPMKDFSNIQPTPNPKPLKVARVSVQMKHTDDNGTQHATVGTTQGLIVNARVDPARAARGI
jgi:hypothetical protein